MHEGKSRGLPRGIPRAGRPGAPSMPDPFRLLPDSVFPWAWALAIAAFLGLWGVQSYYGRRLQTAEAPRGIVSLELAGTKDRTEKILQSWRAEGRADAV